MSGAERSGYRQLTATWLASIAVLVLGLVVFHWYMGRDELLQRAYSEAAVVGSNAGAALIFNDEPAASEMLAALAHSPNVLQAMLYRNDGSLLAEFRTERGDSTAILTARAPAIGSTFSLR